MQHDEKSLPKWAQTIINDLRIELMFAQERRESVEAVNRIMCRPKREWFTIPGPKFNEGEDHRDLFVLDRNRAWPVCSLGKNDVLFIGRGARDEPAAAGNVQ